MKTYMIRLIIVISTVFFYSCDKSPIESEQYKKMIYLVGAQDITRQVELEYSDNPVETFVSISSSGSLNIDKDVKINLETPQALIENYNNKYFEADETELILRPLPSSLFDFPNKDQLVLRASEGIFVRQPIFIKTEDLHPDSVYAIPVLLDKVSEFEINEKLKELIITLKLKNTFSGNYGMLGNRKNLINNSIANLQKNKVLQAVAKNKLRMYIGDVSEVKNTRDSETILLVINDDNTIDVSTWKDLKNVSGSGVYDPLNKSISLKYTYSLNGTSFEVNEELVFIN